MTTGALTCMKTADFRRFLMELAGLEPATSWVRSPRCTKRFSALLSRFPAQGAVSPNSFPNNAQPVLHSDNAVPGEHDTGPRCQVLRPRRASLVMLAPRRAASSASAAPEEMPQTYADLPALSIIALRSSASRSSAYRGLSPFSARPRVASCEQRSEPAARPHSSVTERALDQDQWWPSPERVNAIRAPSRDVTVPRKAAAGVVWLLFRSSLGCASRPLPLPSSRDCSCPVGPVSREKPIVSARWSVVSIERRHADVDANSLGTSS
jgi:hypothetical protein